MTPALYLITATALELIAGTTLLEFSFDFRIFFILRTHFFLTLYFFFKFLNPPAFNIPKYLYPSPSSIFLWIHHLVAVYPRFSIWYLFSLQVLHAYLSRIPFQCLRQIFILCWLVCQSTFRSVRTTLGDPWKGDKLFPVDLPAFTSLNINDMGVSTKAKSNGGKLSPWNMPFVILIVPNFCPLDVSSVFNFFMLLPNIFCIFSKHQTFLQATIGIMSNAFLYSIDAILSMPFKLPFTIS